MRIRASPADMDMNLMIAVASVPLLSVLHAPEGSSDIPPTAIDSAIFEPLDFTRIPREPAIVTVRALLEQDGEPVPEFASWLETKTEGLRPPRFRYEDWQYFAWTIGLSDLQWQASLHRYTSFRGDLARSRVWFDSLDFRVGIESPRLVDERKKLARLAREQIQRTVDETQGFFTWLQEEVLDESQYTNARLISRAATRRIRLGSLVAAYEGIESDPDWILLRELRMSGTITLNDEVVINMLLEDWRAEADRLVERIADASLEYIAAADGSWARLYGGLPGQRAGFGWDSFVPHQRAAEKLFGLQSDWIGHARRFTEILRPAVPGPLLDEIDRLIRRRQCPLITLIHSRDFKDLIAWLESREAANAEVLEGLVAELESRVRELDSIASECCQADRDRRAIGDMVFPLTAHRMQDASARVSEPGERWFEAAKDAIALVQAAVATDLATGLDAADDRRLRERIDLVLTRISERETRWGDDVDRYLKPHRAASGR